VAVVGAARSREDPGALYYIRSRYDELPELLDVTSRVRAISSPELLSSLASIGTSAVLNPTAFQTSPLGIHKSLTTLVRARAAARWQYRMQLAQMWHLSAELDWPSSDQIARLASCVRSGRGTWSTTHDTLDTSTHGTPHTAHHDTRDAHATLTNFESPLSAPGDVTYLCSVEYSEELTADCGFRLSIVAPSDQGAITIHVLTTCKHTHHTPHTHTHTPHTAHTRHTHTHHNGSLQQLCC
jgi:hypothetical protein